MLEKQIALSPLLKQTYGKTSFGSLIINDISNEKAHISLEKQKKDLEKQIRETQEDNRNDRIIQSYSSYFKKWNKTYPIEFQLKTIADGNNFPQVSVLVDCMFLAEIKNRFLTSGHDSDQIEGGLLFDVSEGNERYLKLNRSDQVLKAGDIILRDEEGILASVLYGPAKRTTITSQTKNVLYLVWCPFQVERELLTAHLNDIALNINKIHGTAQGKIKLYF